MPKEDLSPTSNLEEDKKIFYEAIVNTPVKEIVTEFDEFSVHQLLENLHGTKVFILGETHGVKENVDIIYTLFKKFNFGQLALEWEPELKSIVEQFIQTGELDFDAIKDSPDGRITAGHFSLIEKLHEEGL